MPEKPLSYRKTLQMRKNFVGLNDATDGRKRENRNLIRLHTMLEDLDFVDHTALLSSTMTHPQFKMTKLEDNLAKVGMKLNAKKCKVMKINSKSESSLITAKLQRWTASLILVPMLQRRRRRACKLHFEVSPLKIVRASKQYLYDDNGCEYLDCISNVSHVGHCHPHVVHAGQEQMGKLVTSAGFLDDKMVEYAKRIIETLPDQLCVCFFLNSGSEANDLALRLAKSYTKNEDFIVLDHAYHGNIGSLLDLSPSKWKKVGITQKEWVHVVDCPDLYRGKHKDDANPSLKYAQQVHTAIKKAKEKGRNVAAFISEPLMTSGGVIMYPNKYLKLVYSFVRSNGGICIADEIQVGLGRCGESFWSFQMHDVVPDILTVGKPLGNGHPMAMVVTTKEIADSIGEFNSTFGGNPVACAVGMAVLDVIHNEKLMSSARNVGKCLMDGMKAIAPNHPMLGDIRGTGMVIGIEIVTDKESRKPSKEGAEILAYKLKEQKIIIANEGPDKNVMTLLPPMCFTCDNARRVVQAFDLALADIEKGAGNNPLAQSSDSKMNVPLNILSGLGGSTGLGILDDPEDDGESDSKRARYDEMD